MLNQSQNFVHVRIVNYHTCATKYRTRNLLCSNHSVRKTFGYLIWKSNCKLVALKRHELKSYNEYFRLYTLYFLNGINFTCFINNKGSFKVHNMAYDFWLKSEQKPLHIASSQAWTRNLWFPSPSRYPLIYAPFTTRMLQHCNNASSQQ